MTLVVDTAPIVAMADRNDPLGTAVVEVLRREPGELVIPAPVVFVPGGSSPSISVISGR